MSPDDTVRDSLYRETIARLRTLADEATSPGDAAHYRAAAADAAVDRVADGAEYMDGSMIAEAAGIRPDRVRGLIRRLRIQPTGGSLHTERELYPTEAVRMALGDRAARTNLLKKAAAYLGL